MKRQSKSYTQLNKQFSLDEMELKTIHRAARDVWNHIAGDIMEAMNGRSIPRSHVIELVLDADRFEQELKRTKEFKASERLQKMFAQSYQPDTYDFLEAYLKKEVFTYARYE